MLILKIHNQAICLTLYMLNKGYLFICSNTEGTHSLYFSEMCPCVLCTYIHALYSYYVLFSSEIFPCILCIAMVSNHILFNFLVRFFFVHCYSNHILFNFLVRYFRIWLLLSAWRMFWLSLSLWFPRHIIWM